MEIQRTANAGVLLKLDGVSILLDGLCDRVEFYPETPISLAEKLIAEPADIAAFTHKHADHYSQSLVSEYAKQNLRPILGPESLYSEPVTVKGVTVTPVPSRHLGRVEPGLVHHSFLITGSRCVWFMGDATPSQWHNRLDLPKPDVLIAPYAYANSKEAWAFTSSVAGCLVLLHLPYANEDVYGLDKMVHQVIGEQPSIPVYIPQMGETLRL